MAAGALSYIGTLARTLHPACARERWLLMIAYVDAAGTHKGARCFSIAMYLAPAGAWEWFEQQWQTILDDEHLTQLHMTDLEAGHGEFKHWSRARKDALLARFAPLVRFAYIWGFADAIDVGAYRRALGFRFRSSLEKRNRDFQNPHALALWTVIGMVYDIVKNHYIPIAMRERVSMVCNNENAGIRGMLLAHYDEMHANNPRLAEWLDPGLTFKPSRLCLPLQGADFLAWEVAMEMRQRARPLGRTAPVRGSYRLLAQPEGIGGNALVHYFDEARIQRFRDRAAWARLL